MRERLGQIEQEREIKTCERVMEREIERER